MKRRFRLVAALAAIAALVFAQLAMSAYVCPGSAGGMEAMAQMQHDMDSDGGLCERDCRGGKLSLEAAKPSFSSMPLAIAPVLRIARAEPPAWRAVAAAAPLSVAGPAPPLTRYTVLRI